MVPELNWDRVGGEAATKLSCSHLVELPLLLLPTPAPEISSGFSPTNALEKTGDIGDLLGDERDGNFCCTSRGPCPNGTTLLNATHCMLFQCCYQENHGALVAHKRDPANS